MPEKINWTLNVQVTGGPKESASATIEVDGYDKIEAVIPAAGSATVEVQPGNGAMFLLITASAYNDLTYEVDESGNPVTLDGAHVLIGAGAVGLLGATQNAFEFNNNGAADVTVDILVGRNAT
ncbi:MAG TPA: hypothetical protein VLC95_16945 [Anaerolineae bacterium]|nr:hypothetical protein [Anaerolineae bacterium]